MIVLIAENVYEIIQGSSNIAYGGVKEYCM